MAALLVTTLLASGPGTALAHQRLLRAEPPEDALIDAVPRELRLIFNEAVQLAFTSVVVVRADGQAVRLGELRTEADAPAVLIVPIDGRLVSGPVTVRWRTASADGHPVRGEFAFEVLESAEGLVADPDPQLGEAGAGVPAPGAGPLPPEHHPAGSLGDDAFGAESAAYVLVRWITFLALVGIIGAAAFARLVLPLMRTASPPRGIIPEEAKRRAASLGLACAAILLVAAMARLYAQSLAIHGPEQATTPDLVGALIGATIWGWAWILQVGATLLAAAGFLAARGGGSRGWALVAVSAVALAFTPALSGHAAAMSGSWRIFAVLADAAHVLAAGGWIGGLLVLVAVGIPSALRLEAGRRVTAVAALVRAFSPTALGFAGVIILTGVFATLLHSGSLAALVASDYGRLLFVKLAIFLLVFATGAYNYLRVQPRITHESGAVHLRRSATFELTVGLAVLLVTAMLVATARPFETGPDSSAGPALEAQTSSGAPAG